MQMRVRIVMRSNCWRAYEIRWEGMEEFQAKWEQEVSLPLEFSDGNWHFLNIIFPIDLHPSCTITSAVMGYALCGLSAKWDVEFWLAESASFQLFLLCLFQWERVKHKFTLVNSVSHCWVLFCFQVKYWLDQLADELQERLTREAELVSDFTAFHLSGLEAHCCYLSNPLKATKMY